MKKIIFWISIIIFVCFMFVLFIPHKSTLIRKMNEKYTNNDNYVELYGTVISCFDNEIVIKCNELKNYISYEDNVSSYHIYANSYLDINPGDEIYFVTVPFHFYNGHKLPIVEIRNENQILLSFEEGKSNLLFWVNNEFQ